jgi:hypothetical protein
LTQDEGRSTPDFVLCPVHAGLARAASAPDDGRRGIGRDNGPRRRPLPFSGRRFQSFVDRRFYRRKYDARKTLETFSAKLRDETDLDRLAEHLVGAVTEATQPRHASLWLRPETASKDEEHSA